MVLNGKPVGAITAEAVQIVRTGGHVLRLRRMSLAARAVSVLPWDWVG